MCAVLWSQSYTAWVFPCYSCNSLILILLARTCVWLCDIHRLINTVVVLGLYILWCICEGSTVVRTSQWAVWCTDQSLLYILCTSDVLLHLQATFYVLQMFCTCRPHFMYFRCCFTLAGCILYTSNVLLDLQVIFYVLEMFFAPAGHILCILDVVLHW